MSHNIVLSLRILFWCLVLLFVTSFAFGQTFQAEGDGVRVVVYAGEPCSLTSISNLPYKATWTENGKTVEGCAGIHPMGVVLFYFGADKTVVMIPRNQFVRVVGA